MLMSFISHVLSAWFAFLLPSYGTWKALTHRPLAEPDLERWCMYWSVVGAFVAVEYVTGFILDWVPFYWEARTVFLLFLSLPQTQGSTWVYQTYFHPFLTKNQADIDANIAAAQSNALSFIQSRVQVFWQTFWDLATKNQARVTAGGAPAAPGAAPSAPQLPAGGNYADVARGLWSSYGSSLIGAFQQAARPATGGQTANAAAGPAPYDVGSSTGVQAHSNSFTSEMVNNFSPSSSASNKPPSFPEPQVPAA
ncbi:hypothetical protein V8D89_012397 [Ganoderma adspersum]